MQTIYSNESDRSSAVGARRLIRACSLVLLLSAEGHEKLARRPLLQDYAGVLRKLNEYAEAEKTETRATGIQVKNALRAEKLR